MEKRNVMFLMLLSLALLPLSAAYDFCEDIISDTKLEIIDILYQKQAEETTWTWGVAENLNIEVKVQNKNFTTRAFDVELFLIDESNNIESFTPDSDDRKKTTTLSNGETETLNFSIQLKEGIGGTYSLYAQLSDPNNESICTSLEAASTGNKVTVEIESEDKIIIVRRVHGPTNVTAGSSVEYIVEVINLGNIAEDRVLVIAYNAKFGIREEREIINIGIYESKNVTFNLTIPENTTIQEEILFFSTEYGYQNKTGFYYQFSDKAKIFLIQIEAANSQVENETKPETNQTKPPVKPKVAENKSEVPWFWIAIITVFLLLVLAAIYLFLKYNKPPKMETSPADSALVSDYVRNIQNKPSPSNPPSKPSENYTANTNIPQPSQNPPQQPHSPQNPATTPSSPKPTSERNPSSPPA